MTCEVPTNIWSSGNAHEKDDAEAPHVDLHAIFAAFKHLGSHIAWGATLPTQLAADSNKWQRYAKIAQLDRSLSGAGGKEEGFTSR